MRDVFAIATKAAVVRNQRVLVLYKTEAEMRGDRSDNSADLPGGRLGHGEDLVEGLRREVLEESGLAVDVGPVVHAWGFVKPDGTHLVILLYACSSESGEVRLGPEHNHHRWVAAAETASFPRWIGEAVERAVGRHARRSGGDGRDPAGA